MHINEQEPEDVMAQWGRSLGQALRSLGFVAVRRSAQRGDRWMLVTEGGLEIDMMERLPDVLGSFIAAHFPNRGNA